MSTVEVGLFFFFVGLFTGGILSVLFINWLTYYPWQHTTSGKFIYRDKKFKYKLNVNDEYVTVALYYKHKHIKSHSEYIKDNISVTTNRCIHYILDYYDEQNRIENEIKNISKNIEVI